MSGDVIASRADLIGRILDADSDFYGRPLLAALPTWTLERLAYPERVPIPELPTALAGEEGLAELLRVARLDLLPSETGTGWRVYRISFADGAAYVGITRQYIAKRVAEHLNCRFQGRVPNREGSAAVRQRVAAGVQCRVECLAAGLAEHEARDRESAEIRRLKRPLNATAEAASWRDPLAPDPGCGAVARLYRTRGADQG